MRLHACKLLLTFALVGCTVLGGTGCASSSAAHDFDDSIDASEDDLTQTKDTPLAKAFIPATKATYAPGRPGKVRFIIIHDIEGSAQAGINTFKAPGATTSAHYVVSKLGEIVQMVPEANVASHAGHGAFNGYGIGIEHAGFSKNWTYPQAEYEASAKLVADIAKRNRIPIDAEHIVGHSQVPIKATSLDVCSATSRLCGGVSQHDDPGPNWDWTLYFKLVKKAATAIGYDGVGSNLPLEVEASQPAESTVALPRLTWLTRCTDADTQIDYRVNTPTGKTSSTKIESLYTHAAAVCGSPKQGKYPFIVRGIGSANLVGATLFFCDGSVKNEYDVQPGQGVCANASCLGAEAVFTGTSACN
jgi:N-acetyl-anhydromuramyl-L-alanine amidase AmpD